MNEISESHPYLDLQNPQHFINLVPPNLRNIILSIPDQYFLMPEKLLISKIYPDAIPTEFDYQIRIGFWEEYERCFQKCLKINIATVCKGVCSSAIFYRDYAANPGRLMFIIQEPEVTKSRQKYAFHLLLNEVIRISSMKEGVNQRTGLPDVALLDLKLKAFQYIDQRLHGSIIQKIQQQSQNMNVNVQATPEQVGMLTPQQIDDRIRELEGTVEQQALPPPSEPIGLMMEKLHQEAGRVSVEFEREDKRK